MNPLSALYIAVLATGAGAAGVFCYRVACTPAEAPNLLGIRGLKRVRALQASPVFASCEGALRWFGNQVGRVLTPTLRASLDRRLMLAGDVLGLSPGEFVALSLLLSVAAGALAAVQIALATEPQQRVALLVPLAALLPYARLSSLRDERRKRVNHGLPPLIDLLVLCLSAGLDLPGALRHVVAQSSNPDDALSEELGFVLQELRMGKTRKAALTQFAERLPTNSVREFVNAVIQAEERGNPLARVLQIHAEVSRRERSVRAEEAAAKTSTKLMIPMLMMFVAIGCLIFGPLALKMGGAF
jgi:tight adherence protein C